ncbi:hypothetical protein [Halopiger xanaduensis]|uniref:hypothetical protein n=1 Tax=Halopiger xanaduensis TaxID=387343 RepID=UPI00067765D7|nr:hypothetical protein [Halopiger xanaduensis]
MIALASSIGSIALVAGPLQSDTTTLGIAAAIVFALVVFIAVMVYLAFGPHNTVLQDDETPIGRDRSVAGESGAESESDSDSDADANAVQGQPDEPRANAGEGTETDGASST